MKELKEVRPFIGKYVDGQLDDGRLVEFKTRIPHNWDKLMPLIVAMANADGGLILFGIDERTMSVVGIPDFNQQLVNNIETAIKTLSIGVSYLLTHEVVNGKDAVILEIKKAESTSFFSREATSPARQIAYKFKKKGEDLYAISNEKEMRYSKVYKYMTLDAFLTSLYCGTWRFFEPSKWNDKYEQRFYCAKYTLPKAKGNTPQLFATCVTKQQNSEAAWKVYANGQGLGARCLQLELDIAELRKQIRTSGYRFEERNIEYIRDKVLLDLHKKECPHYHEYFDSFTLESFLKLVSLKREAYTYEQELRLFIIPQNGGTRNRGKKAQFKDLIIKWQDVIKKVRVDKKCSDAELASIQRACFAIGINPVIKNYKFIGNLVPSPDFKDIEFEKFDIDDMPGTSCITIS